MGSITNQFIGYWELDQWYFHIDDTKHPNPFGNNATGNLIYSDQGIMAAVLKKDKRANFKYPSLLKGNSQEKINAVNTYISYMGSFVVKNNTIIHNVEHSLLPNWENTKLIRKFNFSNHNNTLTLVTPPAKTSTHKLVVNTLIWKRIL